MSLEYFYRDKVAAVFNGITEQMLAAANRQHDAARHVVSMDRKASYRGFPRSGSKEAEHKYPHQRGEATLKSCLKTL
jgi:hypothetical protein